MNTRTTIIATMLCGGLAMGGPATASDATTSAAIGGLSGALLGSWVGSDEHHSRNAVLLGLIGAGTGYAIGNENDKSVAPQVSQVMVPIATAGTAAASAPIRWAAPGNSGGYQMLSAPPAYGHVRARNRCEPVEVDVWMNGRPRVIETTACRQPDGAWVIADNGPDHGRGQRERGWNRGRRW